MIIYHSSPHVIVVASSAREGASNRLLNGLLWDHEIGQARHESRQGLTSRTERRKIAAIRQHFLAIQGLEVCGHMSREGIIRRVEIEDLSVEDEAKMDVRPYQRINYLEGAKSLCGGKSLEPNDHHVPGAGVVDGIHVE
jgi:hypothetical protein